MGLLVLSGVGVTFLYWFRVEKDARVGQKATPHIKIFSHTLFDEVLQTFVDTEGRLDYARLREQPEKLETYLDRLAVAAPEKMSYNERLAFWVNAYNALVIKAVIDRFPITSVRKVKPFGGFFYRLQFQVAGKSYTLNQIEHEVIREEFVDARVHFVLVCASVGCPSLENRAFLGETIESRLEAATFSFIRNPNKVRLDSDERRLYLSKIFKWYEQDFLEGYTNVGEFLIDYLPQEDAEFLEVEEVGYHYLDYDWTLNDKQ